MTLGGNLASSSPGKPLAALAAALAFLAGCPGTRSQGPSRPSTGAPGPSSCRGPCTVSTPAGATLLVPEGFSAAVQGATVELVDPERLLGVAVVELESESCKDAIRRAWSAVAPAERWKSEQSSSPPPSKGFDEICVESYASRPDRSVAQAFGRRKGRRVWVALVRGPAAALDKRAAQVNTFLSGLRAPGVVEVDLSSRKPASIVASRALLLEFVRSAMKATGTPGLEMAIVEDGRVVLAEGFGVRELGRPDPVTPETLMMIGSVTKSLTTLLMASLVDAGKLSWTRRVREVLPSFRLGDEALAGSLLVEQLVCACAGLPRKDLPLVLRYGGKGADDVLAELALMKPTTRLRETFQYQNHMVAAGGYLAGHVAFPELPLGEAYDRAMAERIFGPLGMGSTTLDFDRAVASPNHATPHSTDLEETHRVVPMAHERFATYIRPSGGVWTNVRDMSRYLLVELARGVTPEGKRVVGEASLTHRWEPQVKISADAAYGLGWAVARSKGLRVITHGGGTMGFATKVAFLPEKGVGVVMIANGTGGHIAEEAIFSRFVELLFGIDDRSGSRLEHMVSQQREALAQLRVHLSPPRPAWIRPLLGKHRNEELGEVEIQSAGRGLELVAGDYRTRLLRHDRADHKVSLVFTDPPLAGLELVPLDGGEGTLELVRAQERYVFRRADP
jgi:CubicO group peptidase (beta-lactamase class C family)